jgi:hypothetical protein
MEYGRWSREIDFFVRVVVTIVSWTDMLNICLLSLTRVSFLVIRSPAYGEIFLLECISIFSFYCKVFHVFDVV